MADRGKTPATGMKITAWFGGYSRDAVADARPARTIPVVPGFYSIGLDATPQFVAVNSEEWTERRSTQNPIRSR